MSNDEALRVAKKLGWSPPHDAEERERRIKQLESALHEACDQLVAALGGADDEAERLRAVAVDA